jgi:hypothetical protein
VFVAVIGVVVLVVQVQGQSITDCGIVQSTSAHQSGSHRLDVVDATVVVLSLPVCVSVTVV